MNTVVGNAREGSAQQVIRDWPEMPPEGQWPGDNNPMDVATAAQHHARNLMLEWHLSLSHLESRFMVNMLFMSAALQELLSQLVAFRDEVNSLRKELGQKKKKAK